MKEKRETNSIKAQQRMQSWLQNLNADDAKIICDGARVQSTVNPINVDSASKLIDRSILKTSQSTFYDRIYLRKYEPDAIRRIKESREEAPSSYLKDHLK